jgi:hypothetical protein
MRQLYRYGIPAAIGAGAGAITGAQEGGLGGAIGGAALGAGLGTLGMGLGRGVAPESGPLAGRFAQALTGLGKKASKKLTDADLLPGVAERLSFPNMSPSAMLRRQMQVNEAGTTAVGALGALGGVGVAGGITQMVQPPLDPESYGSSNSPGARYKASTMQYM